MQLIGPLNPRYIQPALGWRCRTDKQAKRFPLALQNFYRILWFLCFVFFNPAAKAGKVTVGFSYPLFFSPHPPLSFPLSPHLPAFLFLPLQHVLCCPASRRAYRCHCQLFAPSVTLWSREKMSSQKQIAVRFFCFFYSFYLFIFCERSTVTRGRSQMTGWPWTPRTSTRNGQMRAKTSFRHLASLRYWPPCIPEASPDKQTIVI